DGRHQPRHPGRRLRRRGAGRGAARRARPRARPARGAAPPGAARPPHPVGADPRAPLRPGPGAAGGGAHPAAGAVGDGAARPPPPGHADHRVRDTLGRVAHIGGQHRWHAVIIPAALPAPSLLVTPLSVMRFFLPFILAAGLLVTTPTAEAQVADGLRELNASGAFTVTSGDIVVN